MINRRPAIKQIASEAGVAVSTVSRVLNNHPDVSSNTYERVKAIIDRMGFQPNAAARSLVMKRSNFIALITSNIEIYPQSILAQVEHQARKLGYKLFVRVIDPSHSQPDSPDLKLLDELLAYQVDGIIWAVEDTLASHTYWNQKFSQCSIPVVYISSGNIDSFSFVSVDNRHGGLIATQHLIDQGYRHIGLITGPHEALVVQERRAGWEQALHQAGLSASPEQVVEGDWYAPSGEKSLRLLLSRFPQMDAVFISNDQMALGALRAAHAAGRRVPETLGVVGFDNSPMTEYFFPPLSSIDHHFDELGLRAVQEIHRLIDLSPEERSQQTTKSIWIQPTLVSRKSSVRNS
jgi:DNA-binding LacI/PurR family transcriptional regulator